MTVEATTIVEQVLREANVDTSHGLHHALQVLQHVRCMLECEEPKLSSQETLCIELAALLHDLDDRKYFPENRAYENARFVLNKVAPDTVEPVVTMIQLVSTTSNGNSIDGVQHPWMLYPRFADRLEAIGAVGVERCLAFSQHRKRPLFTPHTLQVSTEEELWKVATKERFLLYLERKESESFIDHFYDKLLHIGTLEALGHPKNPYLIQEASKRHRYMVDYILNFDFSL
jgi:uncharacterized protein